MSLKICDTCLQWLLLQQCMHIFEEADSILASSMSHWGFLQIKTSQLVGQEAEDKFESKLKPLLVIWQSLPKAIPEYPCH